MSLEKTRKETIIDRLLEKKEITPFEAVELLKEDYKVPQLPNLPQLPYIPQQIPSNPPLPFPQPLIDWRQKWANDEMNRRMQIAARCSCNPANGGSGVCGCVLTGPVIMC